MGTLTGQHAIAALRTSVIVSKPACPVARDPTCALCMIQSEGSSDVTKNLHSIGSKTKVPGFAVMAPGYSKLLQQQC